MGMLEEIHASAEGWEEAIQLGAQVRWEWDGALLLGSGSSYYLAQVASWLGRAAGYRTEALPSGEVLLHPRAAGSPRQVVGISRSGKTTELLQAVEVLGRPARLVTTNPEARHLPGFGEVVVLGRAQEEAIVQTRSFTSALCFFLTVFLGRERTGHLPRRLDEELDRLGRMAMGWPQAERNFVLGTGPAWGLAQEAALKLKETALVQVEAFHTLEFRHGPVSMVDKGTVVFLLVPKGEAAWERRIGEELAQLGGQVVPVEYTLQDLPLALVPFQLLAYQLARSKGLDPDRPRHLSYAVQL